MNYTDEMVSNAANTAVELLCGELDLADRDRQLVELAVVAVKALLHRPDTELSSILKSEFDEGGTVEEVYAYLYAF